MIPFRCFRTALDVAAVVVFVAVAFIEVALRHHKQQGPRKKDMSYVYMSCVMPGPTPVSHPGFASHLILHVYDSMSMLD